MCRSHHPDAPRSADAASLTLFSDAVHLHTKAGSGHVHHQLLFSNLEKFLGEKSRNNKTRAADCLHRIAEQIHRRSMVVIFSDMMEGGEDQDDLFSALQHLKYNKHEVVLFHVVDHLKELEFEYENRPYVFVDMETGEKVRIQGNEIRTHYKERMQKYLNNLKLRCHQYQIDFVEADINKRFQTGANALSGQADENEIKHSSSAFQIFRKRRTSHHSARFCSVCWITGRP